MNQDDALDKLEKELKVAMDKFPSFRSPHEGFAIILEELDELWEEVKQQHDVRSTISMRYEATQVAAMALRFIIDLT